MQALRNLRSALAQCCEQSQHGTSALINTGKQNQSRLKAACSGTFGLVLVKDMAQLAARFCENRRWAAIILLTARLFNSAVNVNEMG